MTFKTSETQNERAWSIGGVFRLISTLLESHRLGELLVMTGELTPQALRQALTLQRESDAPLGQILVRHGLVPAPVVRRALVRQRILRSFAGILACALSLTAIGSGAARAGSLNRSSNGGSVELAAASVGKAVYPALFGTEEQKSTDISPFTKWTGVVSRIESKGSNGWLYRFGNLSRLSLEEMAERVNTVANQVTYVNDSRNWGSSDYWGTPDEFFTRGGDCEDYAIAKYAALKAFGVPESRMRIAIVHDKIKNIPHAILIVYANTGALVLDNQDDSVRTASAVRRYRPIFSINRQGWWLHSEPRTTVVASAR